MEMIKAIIVLYYMSGFGPVQIETGPQFKSLDECISHFQDDAERILQATGADGMDVACIAPGEMA